MLIKVVGIVMMLDGVMLAMAALPMLNSFVYRSFRDQSFVVAHFVIGALLLLAGRQLIRDRDSFLKNESRSLFAPATVVAVLVVSALEVTRFDWPAFAFRCAYTVAALVVLVSRRR